MMPVDISFVFEDEVPAGKRGFVHADGDDLRFEDGTLARFWGVNFNGGACFPPHDYSEKVATRLQQSGCNIVRFHQLDAEFDTPNIYGFTKGKRVNTTRVFDPKSMDALDYLIYQLKEHGVYVYLDMSTYRHFKEDDGVPQYELLCDNARPWANVSPCLIALQKEQCANFWNHYNPYTKLMYKEDPVFVMSEIVNENDLFMNSNAKKVGYVPATYYENEFREMYRDWLKENNLEDDWANRDIDEKVQPLIDFKIYLTEKFYLEMTEYMRSIGVKIPITGTNWSHTNACGKSNAVCDFTDSHHYYYDWKWGNTERVCAHKSITSSPIVFPNLGIMKTAGKPYFISEWDMPWPNSYRAEGPIYYAAVGALQGWTGFAIHTYAYGTRLDKMEILGKEQSSPVGGIPYREGIFSVWNDPAKFGLFYHAALITRRQDIKPTKTKVAVKCTRLDATVSTPFQTLMETKTAGMVFGDEIPAGYTEVVNDTQAIPLETPGMLVSEGRQMYRDLKKQIGYIDTEMTKVVYGKLSPGGAAASTVLQSATPLKLTDVDIVPGTDFGVIAMSSLTKDPINCSKNILISAIGRARNTGAQFDGEKMIERGTAPIMAEVIQARISIKTPLGQKLKVWGVNAEGYYAGRLMTTYEDGYLTFTIGDELNPACYYLVVAD